MAAGTVEAFAASGSGCPDASCYRPIVATTVETVNVSGGRGDFIVTAPPPPSPTGFGFYSVCSSVISAGIVTVNSATLTMKRASTGVETTYRADVSGALGAAGGVAGVTGVYFGGVFRFPGVSFPDGLYAVVNPAVYPTKMCINVTFPVSFGVGGTTSCTQTICFDAQLSPTLGTVTFGTGVVTYTTLWTF